MNEVAQIILASCAGFVLICLGVLSVVFAFYMYTDAKCQYMSDADKKELRRLKEFENNIIRGS